MNPLQNYSDTELIKELGSRGVVDSRHKVEIRVGDYSMQHPLTCKQKLACPFHFWLQEKYVAHRGLSPYRDGMYILHRVKGKIAIKKLKGKS